MALFERGDLGDEEFTFPGGGVIEVAESSLGGAEMAEVAVVVVEREALTLVMAKLVGEGLGESGFAGARGAGDGDHGGRHGRRWR